jgi:Arc/MetJ family transcription regulator
VGGKIHVAFLDYLVHIDGGVQEVPMIRITITLDETLLEEAKKLLHTRTKRDTVEIALIEVIKQKKREMDLSHCGNIELDITRKSLESCREQQ